MRLYKDERTTALQLLSWWRRKDLKADLTHAFNQHLCLYTNTHNSLLLQSLHRDLMVRPPGWLSFNATFKPLFYSWHSCSAHYHIMQWVSQRMETRAVTQYQCYIKYFYSHGTLSCSNEVFHSGSAAGEAKNHMNLLCCLLTLQQPPYKDTAPFPLSALLKATSPVGGAQPNVVVQICLVLIGCTQRHLCSDGCLPRFGVCGWI